MKAIGTLGHDQVEHAVVRSTAHVCRIMHLLQGVDLSPATPALAAFDADAALYSSLEVLLVCPVTTEARTQAFLPVRLGGLGLKSAVDNRIPARLSSVATFQSRVPTNLTL